MSRTDELHEIFNDVDEGKKKIIDPLINEVIFIEKQLEELKKSPFIKVHPTNPNLQKVTAAGKLYKDMLAQYKDVIKYLTALYTNEDSAENSPLQEYFKRKLQGDI